MIVIVMIIMTINEDTYTKTINDDNDIKGIDRGWCWWKHCWLCKWNMIIEITIVINMTTMAVLIPVIMTITVMIKNNKERHRQQ